MLTLGVFVHLHRGFSSLEQAPSSISGDWPASAAPGRFHAAHPARARARKGHPFSDVHPQLVAIASRHLDWSERFGQVAGQLLIRAGVGSAFDEKEQGHSLGCPGVCRAGLVDEPAP